MKRRLFLTTVLVAGSVAGWAGHALAQQASGVMVRAAIEDAINWTAVFSFILFVLGIGAFVNAVGGMMGKGTARGGEHKWGHVATSFVVCGLSLTGAAWTSGLARTASANGGLTPQTAQQVLQVQ